MQGVCNGPGPGMVFFETDAVHRWLVLALACFGSDHRPGNAAADQSQFSTDI